MPRRAVVPIPAPFAYGPSGRWLTSTHEHEVFICDGNEDHTVHIVALDAAVVGVRNRPGSILALDAQGSLRAIDPTTGGSLWALSVGAGAMALAATEQGQWAAVHAGGICLGVDQQITQHIALPGARFARFDPSGQTLAILTEEGRLMTTSGGGEPTVVAELGFAATGLAHSRLGYWLASTVRGVFRIPVDGSEPQLYLKWGGDAPPMHIACSQNGRLCAFTTESKAVVLFGVAQDTNCGAIVYADREAGELEFGPGAWLGIGIGLGDGNKIDLIEGACHRTDPPDDRPRNRWMLQLGFDGKEIRQTMGDPNEGAVARPSADPRTQWGGDAAPSGQAGPTAGMLVYAVGIIALAAFLIAIQLAGWLGDGIWGWIGGGILGISGISILASRNKG